MSVRRSLSARVQKTHPLHLSTVHHAPTPRFPPQASGASGSIVRKVWQRWWRHAGGNIGSAECRCPPPPGRGRHRQPDIGPRRGDTAPLTFARPHLRGFAQCIPRLGDNPWQRPQFTIGFWRAFAQHWTPFTAKGSRAITVLALDAFAIRCRGCSPRLVIFAGLFFWKSILP